MAGDPKNYGKDFFVTDKVAELSDNPLRESIKKEDFHLAHKKYTASQLSGKETTGYPIEQLKDPAEPILGKDSIDTNQNQGDCFH